MPKQLFSAVTKTYKYTGDVIEIELTKGHYLIEAFGASGGSALRPGGRGAHISAHAFLQSKKTFYLYIGGKGSDSNYDQQPSSGGFNGGGSGGPGGSPTGDYHYISGAGGGGATDIRLVPGQWDDENSLNSRILVAAGGGGSGFRLYGGAGGIYEGLCSELSDHCAQMCGGDQSTYGKGQDGAEGRGNSYGLEGKGGGGGGWFGGKAQQQSGNLTNSGGGGGSSYVSGAPHFLENPEFKFSHVFMEDGKKSQYSGNGYLTITRFHSFTLLKSSFPYYFIVFISILLNTS